MVKVSAPIKNVKTTGLSALLELRNKIKKEKPEFIRQTYHKKIKLKKKWRKPRGIHSKMREKRKGHGKQPSMGYSSPRKIRGLSKKGLKQILVHNLQSLENIKAGEAAVIAKVGQKRKIELVKKCLEKKITILNIKDPEELLKKIEEAFAQRKQITKEEKEKAKEEAIKKSEEKAKEEAKETGEELAKKVEEEKRKILEKKQ